MRESKAARLADDIERWIVRSDLGAGDALGTKAALIDRHNVSMQTVSEAIRLLQSRGVVSVRPGPGGGVFVAPTIDRVHLSAALLSAQDDPRQLDDLFQVQDVLHELVCASAAADCTPRDAERIRLAADRLAETQETPERLRAIWDVDRAIAGALRNRPLGAIYTTVVDLIQGSIERWPVGEMNAAGAVAVHREMAEAVAANDVPRARAAAARHSPVRLPPTR